MDYATPIHRNRCISITPDVTKEFETLEQSFPLIYVALAYWIRYSQFGCLLVKGALGSRAWIKNSSQEWHLYTVQCEPGVIYELK